ncbi:hypothetical protein, partial [Actinobacillus pleuropneumoniae]|uniref:hypothetical protein n=1 Tax=Actinobacillus pleuropneumoniae TaxID=715 RepID=UPI00227B431A
LCLLISFSKNGDFNKGIFLMILVVMTLRLEHWLELISSNDLVALARSHLVRITSPMDSIQVFSYWNGC